METYNEDARQDGKHVPDLLESIIQLPGLVKEELRQKLFKSIQISSKIKKMRVSKFWIPEIQSFPAGGPHNLLTQSFKQETTLKLSNNSKKCWF